MLEESCSHLFCTLAICQVDYAPLGYPMALNELQHSASYPTAPKQATQWGVPGFPAGVHGAY